MNKLEFLNIIKTEWNKFMIYPRMQKIPKDIILKNFLIKYDFYKELNENLKNDLNFDSLYSYLIDIEKPKCKVNNCENLVVFRGIKDGYGLYCSQKCAKLDWGIRQKGKNNTSHRMTPESKEKSKNKCSITTKQNILDGKWTPNITNSWSRSKIGITFIRNNQTIFQNYRSAWEAIYQLKNPNHFYETKRISYINNNGNERIYLVDFEDFENRILIEIKPSKLINSDNNLQKEKFAIEWCKNNDYEFKYISEDELFKDITIDLIKDQIQDTRLLRYFK